jgi:hypothetical protein
VDGDAAAIFCRHISVSHQLPRCEDTLTTGRYVAMHAMQEDSGHDYSTANGYAESNGIARKQPKPQMRDTLAAVGGMLIPLLTQVGHHH